MVGQDQGCNFAVGRAARMMRDCDGALILRKGDFGDCPSGVVARCTWDPARVVGVEGLGVIS